MQLPGLGDPAARAAVTAVRHRGSAAGGAAPAGPPGRTPDRDPDPGARVAGALGAPAPGQGAGRPGAGVAAAVTRPTSRTSYAGWPQRPTTGWTWSSDAASSRSAAASSTSSRRPTSTRCGWSSGATGRGDPVVRRRRPALAGRRAGSGLRHVASCLLTDEVRARAASCPPASRAAEMLDKLAEGHAVEGMESLAPVLVDDMELLVDLLPAGAIVLVCDPSGCGRGPTTWSRPARSSCRRRGRRRPGGARRRSTWCRGVPEPRRHPHPRARRGLAWWGLARSGSTPRQPSWP